MRLAVGFALYEYGGDVVVCPDRLKSRLFGGVPGRDHSYLYHLAGFCA